MRSLIALSVSAVAISCGVFALEQREAKTKALAHPKSWPAGSSIALANRQRETVVAFVHPRADWTASTLEDVRRLMKQHPKALAYVMFVRPETMEEGWEVDEHWTAATQLPNAVVLPDPGGVELARFGARTGEVMVYDAAGALEQSELQVASR